MKEDNLMPRSLHGLAEKLHHKFRDLFSAPHLQQIARQCKFIQRRAKLTAQMFLDMLLFQEPCPSNLSLNDHCVDLQMNYEVQLRKQSLHERFNDRSVAFVRTLLEEELAHQISQHTHMEALKRFTSVKLKDSTRFQLPAQFKDVYPANGGAASQAGMHIQFEFDLRSGKVADLQVTDALQQDNSNARSTAALSEPGSLLLRDMGYFSLEAFVQIHLQKAYYISRLPSHIKLYQYREPEALYEVLDLKQIDRKMKRLGLAQLELQVYLGTQHRVPVRLFVERVPPCLREQRVRAAQRTAQRKGRTLSPQYKLYAAFSLFITNVPIKWLPGEHIRTLYRLRWQIELRFKVWKTLCRLHVVTLMNRYRFETYLYAKLLFIILHWQIAVNLQAVLWQHQARILSIYKYYKAMIKGCRMLRIMLFDKSNDWGCYLKLLYKICLQNLMAEKRKRHLSQQEILCMKLESV